MKAQAKEKPGKVNRHREPEITPEEKKNVDDAIAKRVSIAEAFRKQITTYFSNCEEWAKKEKLTHEKEILNREIAQNLSAAFSPAFSIGFNETLRNIKIKLYNTEPLLKSIILHGYEVKLKVKIIAEFESAIVKGIAPEKKENEISSEYYYAAIEIYLLIDSGIMPSWIGNETNEEFFTRMCQRYGLKNFTGLETRYGNYSRMHLKGNSIDPIRKVELTVLKKEWKGAPLEESISDELATIEKQENVRKQKGNTNQ